jgi:DNA-binding CsgD family transcriptional regulator
MPPESVDDTPGFGEYPSSDAGPSRGAEAVVLLLIGALLAVDLASDTETGKSGTHVALELGAACIAVAALAWIWGRWLRARRALEARAKDLAHRLDRSRADADHWRAEARDALAGLGAAIDVQFQRWRLTEAERGVGLLLLKGLSLKEIAEARQTSERTVRQQALAIYKKAGLSGRAELAAFFLEDLLLPTEPRPGS